MDRVRLMLYIKFFKSNLIHETLYKNSKFECNSMHLNNKYFINDSTPCFKAKTSLTFIDDKHKNNRSVRIPNKWNNVSHYLRCNEGYIEINFDHII